MDMQSKVAALEAKLDALTGTQMGLMAAVIVMAQSHPDREALISEFRSHSEALSDQTLSLQLSDTGRELALQAFATALSMEDEDMG